MLIGILLIGPAASAVPYLQKGFDAARTGATTDPGPAVLEEAFSVDLNGSSVTEAPPVVIGDAIYALVGGEDQDEPSALYRVDLATAERLQITDLPTRSSSLASDGERLLVAEGARVAAYTLDGEGPIWTWDYPDVLPVAPASEESYLCVAGALHKGTYYVGCSQADIDDAASFQVEGVGPQDASPSSRSFVAALDPETGEPHWTWIEPDRSQAGNDPDSASGSQARHLAVAGGTVTLVTGESSGATGEDAPRTRLWGLHRSTGETRWDASWMLRDRYSVSEEGSTGVDYKIGVAPIIATSNAIYVNLGNSVEAIEPTNGTTVFAEGLPDRDGTWFSMGTFEMALRGDALFVGSGERLLRFDLSVRKWTWETTLQDGGWDGSTGLLATDEALLGHTDASDTIRGYRAFSLEDGELLWQRRIEHTADPNNRLVHAVGEGVLAFLTSEGQLTVVGSTPASIQPTAETSDLYPAVEEPVRVNLSDTEPGVLGNETEFSVAWGDGRTSPWQASPAFEHAYGASGDHTAVFRARNDAGQTARTEVTFHVGEDPPPEPNVVETAFQRENQDLTFGVLGIVVALGGGVIAVARRRRKRGRLERELAAIQEVYEANEDQPRACEAALAERRAHVQGLLLDGKIEDGQAQILENRIDELSRQVRVGLLDERFQFLPHGLVLSLKDMLEDGQITAWEREHVLSALEGDETLTEDQRDRVRDLVDEWFSRDTGSAG